MKSSVGPPTVTLHSDDQFVVCAKNGEMSSEAEQGYFVADTCLASGYRLKLGQRRPVLLNAAAIRPHSARFEFTNDHVLDVHGDPVAGHCLHLRLDRTLDHGMHEDYDIMSFCDRPVSIDLEVSIESDFADLFDVKNHRRVRRGAVQSTWESSTSRLTTRYVNREFSRGFVLQIDNADSSPEFANGGNTFKVDLSPGARWHACMLWLPIVDVDQLTGASMSTPCHDLLGTTGTSAAHRDWIDETTHFATADATITAIVTQAVEDLAALRLHRHDDSSATAAAGESKGRTQSWVPAAGVPWYVTLFGRDALIVSLQTLSLSPRFVFGSLRSLGSLQADGYDDGRDMQPGKVHHEIRYGELATLGLIPQTPYYGTHDATMLYVMLAAEAWRWSGDRAELDAVRPHVERALAWIDTDGDSDGDGLQEYQPRGPNGFYNQGWKDAHNVIVGADGRPAKLPIALCEHQGLVVAAKRAWAQILDDVYDDQPAAAELRKDAARLADEIDERFWWEQEGTYYLGLDGDKRPIESVASNAAQMLWLGVARPERAAAVARRLMAPDMWSGWGIRTLSADHVAYNPFSYQLGSVWPHDNIQAAAGFRAYGLDEPAHRVGKGILGAAAHFEAYRLPEVFAGVQRDEADFPVQYLGANTPQAWASGSLIHLIAVLLGLDADASHNALTVNPALPEWLDEITISRLGIGRAFVDLSARRLGDGTHTVTVNRTDGNITVTDAGSPNRSGPSPTRQR